ncbi:type VI secretion system Vgr family protein [Acanthopleuribacter pedis]|uniref:Type VI secretion system tip protein VgrG n=1 Tax=Acanthopleuribacter pedis TaxID=442870 RepID=A0A8J7Q9F2_9BACT|nr:type VI secretion system tip protein TssI/VgrG [Acanthopleuribacter pedis]MBO1321076.1 type VI secretion system tip protein VgrG [Acanthopleuribacter pedis]
MSVDFDNPGFSLTTPFGDELRPLRFEGRELMSGLYQFQVTMLSANHQLDFKRIVGRHLSLSVGVARNQERVIDGLVTEFRHAGLAEDGVRYIAVVRPWLWQCSLTNDCRIFQNKTVPEMVKTLFRDYGFGDFEFRLRRKYAKREYCVMYMENALNFVKRLLEEEGIFFFFRFEVGKHTMILADEADAYLDCVGSKQLEYRPFPNDVEKGSSMEKCEFSGGMTVGGVVLDDYDFEAPSAALLARAGDQGRAGVVYRYPGGFREQGAGEARAKLLREAYAFSGERLSANSVAGGLTAGGKFTMLEHPREALNGDYIVHDVHHQGDKKGYRNRFSAFPVDHVFRPLPNTPRPRIFGAQTAVVVGKKGEEIWTDRYGRVKVQFHWDREGRRDENSSCWVRVSQGWAGKQYGSFFLPRIGQEVVVTFLDGNPDRPLITGAVYNAQQTVPLQLPGQQTRSTVKTNTSKGGAGFNQISFEDKKDHEQLTLHAQKDMQVTVRNDASEKVGNHRKALVEKGHDTLEVAKGDANLKVPKGVRRETVKERVIEVTRDEAHRNNADYRHEVRGDYTLRINGDLTIEAMGNITIKAGRNLTLQSGQSLSLKAGTDIKQNAGTSLTQKAGISLKAQAGADLELKSGATAKLKAGAMAQVQGGGMLMLKGGLVKIN